MNKSQKIIVSFFDANQEKIFGMFGILNENKSLDNEVNDFILKIPKFLKNTICEISIQKESNLL